RAPRTHQHPTAPPLPPPLAAALPPLPPPGRPVRRTPRLFRWVEQNDAHRSRRNGAGCPRILCGQRALQTNASAANAELVDQQLVTPLVGALQVIEQLTALGHELEKPAPRMVVLNMGLEMLGEIVDPL